MMNDTIETLDDLHNAMITRYPALADRERYAAIYTKMALQWPWVDTLQREEQDRLAVMAQWVRLDIWGLDEANTLCAIEIRYAEYIDLKKEAYQRKLEAYQRKFAALSEDMNRTLHDMMAQAHYEIEEATRDLMIKRADAQEAECSHD